MYGLVCFELLQCGSLFCDDSVDTKIAVGKSTHVAMANVSAHKNLYSNKFIEM